MKTTSRPVLVLCRCRARRFSTAPSPAAIAATLTSRPAKHIPDALSPTPSHLLNITLADLIPAIPSPSSPHQKVQPMPQGHHLAYFPIQTPPSGLATDGADLDHWPGPPFHRRMWAAGEVRFRDGWAKDMVLDGRRAKCVEKIEEVNVKGEGERQKVFVDVWRRYGLAEDVATGDWPIQERRTLVFMPKQEAAAQANSSPTAKVIKYPHQPTASYTLRPTTHHLFHFSALSFNAHLIHLDPGYCRSIDGHRNLLVHGPLTLSLMLRVVSAHIPEGAAVKSIVYRNHAPLYVNEDMRICVRKLDTEGKWDVWVEGPGGGLAVRSTVMVEANGLWH
ncbi:hypothetical protein LIA77_08754 [Sarocladium implicatum]|nr:hypothetical protein LIA77_08754 [Sarocladium implicatum]